MSDNYSSERFRFETLLKLRENERDSRAFELAEIQNCERSLKGEIEDLESSLVNHLEQWNSHRRKGPIDVELQIHYHDRQNYLSEQKKALLLRLNAVIDELEAKRHELNEAIREVKVFENLRERDREKALELRRRTEANQMDDLYGEQKSRERQNER